jgi:hypothetical protein
MAMTIPQPPQDFLTQHGNLAELPPIKKRRRKWPWITGGIVVVLITVIAATAGNGKTSNTTAPTGQTTATGNAAAAAATAATTAVAATTTPPPAPPTVIQGRGDDVVPVTRTGPTIVEFSCPQCGSNTVLESDGADSVLVNTIGAYSGMRALDMADGSTTSQLTVKADSAWTLTLGGFDLATHANGPVSGHGDDVVVDTGSASAATIINQGSANFVVQDISQATDSMDLVVNEIGDYTGTDPIALPGIIEITSDGSWSITPS